MQAELERLRAGVVLWAELGEKPGRNHQFGSIRTL